MMNYGKDLKRNTMICKKERENSSLNDIATNFILRVLLMSNSASLKHKKN
jgi:hypothetical protein